MSTSVVSPAVIDVKTNNETYRVYTKSDVDGKIVDVKTGTGGKDDAWFKKMDAEVEAGIYQLQLEQTVKFYKAGSAAGIEQLIPDEEERVAVFNRGASQKQNQKLIGALNEINVAGTGLVFEPVDGYYDLNEALNAPSQRRSMSATERALSDIRKNLRTVFPNDTPEEFEARVHSLFS